MLYIYIAAGLLQNITAEPDTEAVVHPPGTSLITDVDWAGMCTAAGGEAALIAQLGVTDIREVGNDPNQAG
jgi:hypothetical protein